jgi:hypothetical protein
VVPRWLLATLVFALPVLLVTLGVVLGAAALLRGVGDAAAARGLTLLATAAGILLVIDALLLLTVLGLRALDERNGGPRGDQSS